MTRGVLAAYHVVSPLDATWEGAALDGFGQLEPTILTRFRLAPSTGEPVDVVLGAYGASDEPGLEECIQYAKDHRANNPATRVLIAACGADEGPTEGDLRARVASALDPPFRVRLGRTCEALSAWVSEETSLVARVTVERPDPTSFGSLADPESLIYAVTEDREWPGLAF